MFTITDKKNPKKHGLIWDAKSKQPLIKFVKGQAATEDKAVAEKLKKMGYEVTENEPTKNDGNGNNQD